MLGSIRGRLILFSALPSILFLVLAVVVVLGLARGVQRAEFEATLEQELLQLIAWAQVTDDGAFDPQLPEATRFETTFSGWYYQVYRLAPQGNLDVVASSQSLQQSRLNLSAVPSDTNRWRTQSVGPQGETLMIMIQRARAVTLADNRPIPNPDDEFLIAVARSEAPLARSMQTIYGALGVGVAAAAIFFTASTLALLAFTLSPLRNVQQSLQNIRSGKASRLDGEFPSEIQPMAEEIDLLLDENEKIVERARTQVGNLAHALKTPLSVLTNEAGSNDSGLARAVRDQASLMKGHVDRYLARARVAATSQVLGARTEIGPAVERLGRALQKIHMDREIALDVDVPAGLSLRGEQQDFEEIVGNVLENAFKWAASQIELKAWRDGDDLVVTIADDGPGLAPEERATALKRGQRLDETTPGTGLGLSIVADIVSAYGGEVSLGKAALGGLEVTISLPSAP
jgi:signal transduction histidine kinase